MTVSVTGDAGYIGSHMVLKLLGEGKKVVVLDNLSTGHLWAVGEGADFVVGDINDVDLVTKTIQEFKVDDVIHFARSIVVPESVENPKSPYGLSKLMAEWMLEDILNAHDFNFEALRYFNVAGADPEGRTGQSTPNATHLIRVANQVALKDRPFMEIYGDDYDTEDSTCLRDYIHVSDLIGAHYFALQYLQKGGNTTVMNCGYGKGYSVKDVVEAVKNVSKENFEIKMTERRVGDPAIVISNPALI